MKWQKCVVISMEYESAGFWQGDWFRPKLTKRSLAVDADLGEYFLQRIDQQIGVVA